MDDFYFVNFGNLEYAIVLSEKVGGGSIMMRCVMVIFGSVSYDYYGDEG